MRGSPDLGERGIARRSDPSGDALFCDKKEWLYIRATLLFLCRYSPFLKNRTPRQDGPQWLEMVHPATVSMTSVKG